MIDQIVLYVILNMTQWDRDTHTTQTFASCNTIFKDYVHISDYPNLSNLFPMLKKGTYKSKLKGKSPHCFHSCYKIPVFTFIKRKLIHIVYIYFCAHLLNPI